MLCSVYKSSKKDETYLYITKKDDFSQVPEPLMNTFGTPLFVLTLPLMKVDKLAQVDKQKLVSELNDKGFYLQLPPPRESLLKSHLAEQKAKQS